MDKQLTRLFLIIILSISAYAQGVMPGLLEPQPPAGGQTILDTDTFSGTAATNLHTYNANWENSPYSSACNDGKISTPNGGVAGFASCDDRTGFTWTNNQFAQATLGTISGSNTTMVCVRAAGSSGHLTGYCGGAETHISSTTYYIQRSDQPGGFTTLQTYSQTPALGDIVNLQIKGSVLTLKVNGVALSPTATDTTYTTGNPGIDVDSGSGSTVNQLNTWSAGSVQ
jgi:hypothetical protein